MRITRKKYLIPLILASIVIGVLLAALIFPKNSNEQLEISNLDLNGIEDIYGSPISVKSTVVVHFFASWCTICKADMEKFAKYEFREKVPVIAISLTDTPSVLQTWLTKAKLREVYFRISVPNGNSPLRKLNIKTYPQTFVIGKDGKVLYHARGELSNKMIEDEILPKFGVLY